MQNLNPKTHRQARRDIFALLLQNPCEYDRLEEVCASTTQCAEIVAFMIHNREITVDARGMIRTNTEAPGI